MSWIVEWELRSEDPASSHNLKVLDWIFSTKSAVRINEIINRLIFKISNIIQSLPRTPCIHMALAPLKSGNNSFAGPGKKIAEVIRQEEISGCDSSFPTQGTCRFHIQLLGLRNMTPLHQQLRACLWWRNLQLDQLWTPLWFKTRG